MNVKSILIKLKISLITYIKKYLKAFPSKHFQGMILAFSDQQGELVTQKIGVKLRAHSRRCFICHACYHVEWD